MSEQSIHEQLARIEKRDRIIVAIVRQARTQPHFTWAQVTTVLEGLSPQNVEKFVRGCGEEFSDTTLSKTWPMVIAVVRSWAESDERGMERAV